MILNKKVICVLRLIWENTGIINGKDSPGNQDSRVPVPFLHLRNHLPSFVFIFLGCKRRTLGQIVIKIPLSSCRLPFCVLNPLSVEAPFSGLLTALLSLLEVGKDGAVFQSS